MVVTLRDVAAAAGVSVSTASRVLSGARPVRDANASAVLEAASRLGYEAHHVARSLRRQTTQSVGVVVPVISNPFFPLLVQTVERALHHVHGLAVMICDSQDRSELEIERVHALLARQVDALLLVPCHVTRSIDAVRMAADAVPVVQIDRWVDEALTDVVSVDHAAGIRAVVEHVVATGRRRLAYAGAVVTNAAARTRVVAFGDTLERSGLPVGPRVAGTYTIAWGRVAAERLLDADLRLDAIVCGNDLIAMGVLGHLREHGVAVPDDVAVTGFDGIEFTEITTPPLTTVRQPIDRIADRTVDLMLRRIGGATALRQVERLAGELLVRASSVPSGDRQGSSDDG